MTALAVEGVWHGFGGRLVLEDVSFALEEGNFAVLLGPNGAGKTTLVSLITGLYHARTGEIRVFARSLRREPAAALSAIGVVFQQPSLDLDLSVAENLRYHAALHGLSRGEAADRGAAELERFGLHARAHEKARTLSGGLRRRVEIARALIHRPRLLVLDEPTVGLDPSSRAAILDHVRALCRERGISVLWATHLLDEVAETDPVIVLHRGAVAWRGVAADLRREAGGDLRQAFLTLTGEAA